MRKRFLSVYRKFASVRRSEYLNSEVRVLRATRLNPNIKRLTSGHIPREVEFVRKRVLRAAANRVGRSNWVFDDIPF